MKKSRDSSNRIFVDNWANSDYHRFTRADYYHYYLCILYPLTGVSCLRDELCLLLSLSLSRGFSTLGQDTGFLVSLSRVDDRPPYAALLSLYASIFFPGRPLLRLGRSLAALSLFLGSGDAFRQSTHPFAFLRQQLFSSALFFSFPFLFFLARERKGEVARSTTEIQAFLCSIHFR